jgi:hypothetical protein
LNLALDVLAHGGSLREFFIGCPGWWMCAIVVGRTLTICGDSGGSHSGGGFSWEIGKRFAGHSQSTPHSGGGFSKHTARKRAEVKELAKTSPLRWGFLALTEASKHTPLRGGFSRESDRAPTTILAKPSPLRWGLILQTSGPARPGPARKPSPLRWESF